MLCWQEVCLYFDFMKIRKCISSTGVVVGASADMVLQPYGAFLAGNQSLFHTACPCHPSFNQQEVPLG